MADQSEFDNLAEEYDNILKQDLQGVSEDVSVFAEYKVKLVRSLFGGEPESLLEFGCGIGRNIPYLSSYFPSAKISGCDNSEKSIEYARAKYADRTFFLSDTIEEFLRNAVMYDACFIACVMHHIPPADWVRWLTAIRQKLKPGGEVVVFEHNLYNPLVKRIVTRSPIDATANFLTKKTLSGLLREAGYVGVSGGYAMFFPKRTALLEKIEWRLRKIPLGGQYWVQAKSV